MTETIPNLDLFSCLLFIAFCYSPGQIRLSSSLRRCYTQVLRFLTGRWNNTWQHVRCHPATLPPWQAIQWLKQNDRTPCRSWVFKYGWSVLLSIYSSLEVSAWLNALYMSSALFLQIWKNRSLRSMHMLYYHFGMTSTRFVFQIYQQKSLSLCIYIYWNIHIQEYTCMILTVDTSSIYDLTGYAVGPRTKQTHEKGGMDLGCGKASSTDAQLLIPFQSPSHFSNCQSSPRVGKGEKPWPKSKHSVYTNTHIHASFFHRLVWPKQPSIAFTKHLPSRELTYPVKRLPAGYRKYI